MRHHSERPVPLVSIGVPVYNGESTLRVALDSLVAQSFTDFEIVISDNASTDGTAEICREFSDKDDRIIYHRQPTNIGAGLNFKFVMDQARGRYYMWNAHDDSRSPDFLEINVRNLENNPELVASTSINKSLDKARRRVDFACRGNQYQRMRTLIENIYDSGCVFYSLMKTDVIQKCGLVGKIFPAADWAIDIYLLQYGEIDRVAKGEAFFGDRGVSTQPDAWRIFAKTWHSKIWPSGAFTMYALIYSHGMGFFDRLRFIRELVYLNRQALREYYRYRIPWLFRK